MKITAAILLLALGTTMQAGELEKLYEARQDLPKIGISERPFEKADTHRFPYTEVGMERVPGLNGDAPSYTVIFKADGSFVYTGGKNVKNLGIHNGRIDTYEMRMIFQYIDSIHFFDMDESSSLVIADSATIYLMVAEPGRKKIIRSYDSIRPLELWVLDQLIENAVTHAAWDDKSIPKPIK